MIEAGTLRTVAALAAAAILGVTAARAQMSMHGNTAVSGRAASPPWIAGNAAAMSRMDQAMAHAPPARDEDHAFVDGMMPHHQGAVDMARVELAHGHDPRLRALARGIIAAQERELGIMRAWLRAHPDAS